MVEGTTGFSIPIVVEIASKVSKPREGEHAKLQNKPLRWSFHDRYDR